MKNLRSLTLTLLAILGLLSCSGGGSDPNNGDEKDPSTAALVFPESNKKCTEGVILNTQESTINFQWNNAENTDSYEINLKNLQTNSSAKFESQTNSLNITLTRGIAYEWFIVSKSNTTTTVATSEKWRFYNQGVGQQSYTPFPAEAISPTRGKLLNTAGTITLEWKGTDIDNDIVSYEVFFGTTLTPTTSLGTTVQTTFTVTVNATQTYYWSVKTKDSKGNTSNSEIFDFKVK